MKSFKQFLQERTISSKKHELIDKKELFDYVEQDNMTYVKQLISEGANPNIENSEKRTPVFYARHINMVEYLCENGADINHKDAKGFTPILFHAKPNTKESFFEYMDTMLKYNADIFVETNGYTLFDSAKSDLVLRYIAERKIKNKGIDKPIDYHSHIASFDTEIGQEVLDLGYKFDFAYLLKNKEIPMVVLEFILENHNKIEQSIFKDWIDDYRTSDAEKLKLFMRYGYKIRKSYINSYNKSIPTKLLGRQTKIENKDSSVIFEWIEDNDFKDIEHAIKNKSVDFNIIDKEKETPLMYALTKKKYDIAHLLINNKINIKKASDKRTPLLYAVMLGQHDIVETLISLKVDVNYKNKEGATAIFWAVKKGDLKMVKILVDAGADIHIVTQEHSLLDMKPSSEEVMEYLESLGVKSAK